MYPPEPQYVDYFVQLLRPISTHFEAEGHGYGYGQVWKPWLGLALALVLAKLAAGRLLARHPAALPQTDDGEPASPLAAAAAPFLLALLGFWLRARNITLEPLEMQEASELYHLFQGWSWPEMAFLPNRGEPHQFLLQVLIYPFQALAEIRHIRLVGAGLGACVAPAVFLTLRRLGFASAFSLAAAGLVATSPLHVYFSRAVLPYALFSLLSTLLVCSAASYAREGEPSRAWRRSYVALQVLAMATHLAHLVVGTCVLLAVLADRQSSPRNRLMLLNDTLAAAICFLPFVGRSLVFFTSDVSGTAVLEWLAQLEVFDRKDIFDQALSYFAYVFSAHLGAIQAGLGDPTRWALALASAGLFGIGLGSLLRRRSYAGFVLSLPAAYLLFHIIFVGPYGMHLQHGGAYFAPRRIMTTYPLALIVSAVGIAALASALRARRFANVLLAGLAVAFFLQSTTLHKEATLPAGDEAAEYLRQELRDGDGVLFGPSSWMRWIVTERLFAREDPRRLSQFISGDFLEIDYRRSAFPEASPAPGMSLNLPELYALAPTLLEHLRLERVWLVHIRQHTAGWPEFAEDHSHMGTLERALAKDFELRRQTELRSMTVRLYERKSRSAPPAEGYVVDLRREGYAFLSNAWPPPFLPTTDGHHRHLLPGGRLDLPVPGPGRWRFEIEARFEGAKRPLPLHFLYGLRGGSSYRVQSQELSAAWEPLVLPVTVEAEGETTFVWEFRPEEEPRPFGPLPGSWPQAIRYLQGNPLQIRSVRLERLP